MIVYTLALGSINILTVLAEMYCCFPFFCQMYSKRLLIALNVKVKCRGTSETFDSPLSPSGLKEEITD